MPSSTLIPRFLPAPTRAIYRVTKPRAGCVVHCPGSTPVVQDPATLEDAKALIRKVAGWHARRGFKDIGYHRAVWREHVFELCALDRIGRHAKSGRWPFSGKQRPSFNASHYGVLVLHPADVEPHPDTIATTIELCDELVPGGEIVPHRSLTTKECPGRFVLEALPRERNPYVDQRTGMRNR